MEGRIDSWAIRFSFNCFERKMYNIYPVTSMVKNIGNDGTGTHTKSDERFTYQLKPFNYNLKEITFDEEIMVEFRKFHKKSLIRRIIYYYYRLRALKNQKTKE